MPQKYHQIELSEAATYNSAEEANRRPYSEPHFLYLELDEQLLKGLIFWVFVSGHQRYIHIRTKI